MAEILIGQAYFMKFDSKLWEAMRPYPPLGALYAAGYLRERGFQVALFDAMLAESEAEWQLALSIHQPKLAVLYEDNFNYLSKMCLLRVRQAAIQMIDMAKRAGCLVIVAGSDASDHPEAYLSFGADYVVIGEGELTLCELASWCSGRSQKSPDEIAGLSFFQSDRTLFRTPRRPGLNELDKMPFPAWDLIDINRYRKIWIEKHGYFSMNATTGRGCPFHCNWCAKPIWGQRFQVRSPENVAAEMVWLKETCAPDHIWFTDDIFGLKPGWVEQYARAVESNGGRIPFKCLNRADLLLREGEIEALRRAGCRMVWIGAESGSQKILDAMDKGIRIEQIYMAASQLRRAGIKLGFFLQFGYPGETRQDIALTFKLVRECLPDDIGVSVSYPLPGTPFYEMVRAELGQKRNWTDSNDLAMLYKGPYKTEFYRQLHQVLHGEFRARLAWRDFLSGKNQSRLKSLARSIFEGFVLPARIAKLELLARQPHSPIGPLSGRLNPEEAAQPSHPTETQ
jgi:anaerobic magnesium-protoporphyrin IX monomethyl ester cyclase